MRIEMKRQVELVIDTEPSEQDRAWELEQSLRAETAIEQVRRWEKELETLAHEEGKNE